MAEGACKGVPSGRNDGRQSPVSLAPGAGRTGIRCSSYPWRAPVREANRAKRRTLLFFSYRAIPAMGSTVHLIDDKCKPCEAEI